MAKYIDLTLPLDGEFRFGVDYKRISALILKKAYEKQEMSCGHIHKLLC